MKNIKKIMLVTALALMSGAFASNAQIVVKVRPERPHYERVPAPSPRHVWIEEDWRPKGNTYEFSGGHWAEPTREGARWIPGHWKETPQGQVWRPGHWR